MIALLAAAALAFDDGGNVHTLMFLADDRPVLVRLLISVGDRTPEAAWRDSTALVRDALDRDHDGVLARDEVSTEALAALVRLGGGDPAALPRGNLDDLAAALRPALGPFRVQAGAKPAGRTDALFDHLDRDKDGLLARPELSGIAGALRRLDLDDDEMIAADELDPFRSPAPAVVEPTGERRPAVAAAPTVVELVPGESSLRPARMLLKRYDRGRPEAPGRPDGKLSADEFAVDPDAFTAADRNTDGQLDADDLRRYVASEPIDLTLVVAFPSDPSERPTVKAGDASHGKGVSLRQLADDDVEIAVGKVRIDLRLDPGAAAADRVAKALARRFQAADANRDGYLEGKEIESLNAPGSPFAGLATLLDVDRDGKVQAAEEASFVARQVEGARGRLTLEVADEGRALFGVLDRDRDRRLGTRELMKTLDRLADWDADGDGRVAAEEVPYHILITLARGRLAPPDDPRPGTSRSLPDRPTSGPDWHRRMDRNRDGDVSRREFLGPRDAFDKLDRDKDGLIDAEEAAAARP